MRRLCCGAFPPWRPYYFVRLRDENKSPNAIFTSAWWKIVFFLSPFLLIRDTKIAIYTRIKYSREIPMLMRLFTTSVIYTQKNTHSMQRNVTRFKYVINGTSQPNLLKIHSEFPWVWRLNREYWIKRAIRGLFTTQSGTSFFLGEVL